MAVIAAFVLIALAIFVRGLLVDDDEGGATKGDKGDDGGSLPVVACTPDLASVCDALAADGKVAEEPPSLDLSGAAQPPSEVDAWITWSPAPEIANFAAGQPKVWEEPEVLGSAREAVLIDEASARELAASCRSEPTWSCLAAAAPGLAIGVGDPATAEGIARLAPLARTFTTDDDYTALDTEALRDLIASPSAGQADAATQAGLLATRPGALAMATGANDLLAAQTRTPQGEQRGLRVLSPAPATRLVVVLAERAGRDGSADGLDCEPDPPDALAESLDALGLQPCEGDADAALAGFLFQVQRKVG